MAKDVLLLHGALGSSTQLSGIKKHLSSFFNVHTLDFSGHGNHASSKAFSMELFEEDVLNFMTLHSLGKISIFGYSMGGYVGLKLAADYPEKIDKLMTLGTKIAWNPKNAEKEISRLNPNKMLEKIPHYVNALRHTHAANDWESVVNKTANMMHNLGHGKALGHQEFKKIKTPVLVTRGEQDFMVNAEESLKLVQHLKNGRFKEIENAKHPIDQVSEDKLCQILIDFMNGA